MTYELHPLCTLFPRLQGLDFDALCQDIKANGLREPIVLHDGMILDGGNRYRACMHVGVEPEFREFEGGSIVAYVLSANLHRRHMTPGQQAAIVASAQDWAKAQVQGANRHTMKTGNVAGLETVTDRASQSGASERTQRMADKVAKADPGLAKQVAHGEVSLPKAVKQVEAKNPPKPKKTTVATETASPVTPEQRAPGPVEKKPADDDRLSDAELLQEMQSELDQARAKAEELEKALLANDDKAKFVELIRRLDHAVREQHKLMADAVALKKRSDFYERQLARCGKAVGQRDLDKVAPAVEAMVRAQKVAA